MVGGFVATELPSQPTGQQTLLLLLTGLFSHAVIWAVFAISARTVARNAEAVPISWWQALTIYLLAAWLRLIVILAGLSLAEIPDQTPLGTRFVTSTLLIPLAYGFSSYSLESLRRYLDHRQALIEKLIESEVQLQHQSDAVDTLRETFMGGVEAEIGVVNARAASALEALEKSIRRGEDARPELQALLSEADSGWRTISHSTWQAAKLDIPRVSAREFLDILSRSQPLSYLAVSISAIFVFLLGLSREVDLSIATVWTMFWLVFALLGAWVVNESAARSPNRHNQVFLLGLVALVLMGGIFLLVPGIELSGSIGAWIIHAGAISTAVSVGMGPALVASQDRIINSLERFIDKFTIRKLTVESELVVLARQVAARLHAGTRGVFLAHVLRLQSALDREDMDGSLAEIATIRAVLVEGAPPPGDELSDVELNRFIDNWRGLVSIETNLHLVTVPEHVHPAINQVVIEAINDAIRHGGADWLDVDLEPHDEHAVLTIVSNGIPPASEVSTGLGGTTLDRLSGGRWTRQVDPAGLTRLRVELAYGPDEETPRR